MSPFQGRVAIVTGASSGIGQATALRLAQEGCDVIAIARRAERLAIMNSQFPSIHPVPCDLGDPESVEKHVAQAIERLGRVDILVNNAGFSYYERLENSTLERWRQTMAVNVEAMFILAKLVVPYMKAKQYGRIVNVSSTQAIAAEATVGAYAASKGAVEAWSRSLAVDLAPDGILVNVVAPGCTHTEMSVIDDVDETKSQEFQEWYVQRRKIPLARAGTSVEIANAIVFLCGDQCTYITGQTLVVDGGLTITF
jgi:NAD(P)-dependent dehydrogenase (short-subunit alcohol dehydrogenase family)